MSADRIPVQEDQCGSHRDTGPCMCSPACIERLKEYFLARKAFYAWATFMAKAFYGDRES